MTGDSEQFESVYRNFTRTLASRQRRTTVALDNTEIGNPVLVAEPPNPTIFTGEDGNDTATHTAAFTHPFTHDCEPLLLGASRRQQISLDEYHRHAAGGVAAARSLSHAIPRATSKATMDKTRT